MAFKDVLGRLLFEKNMKASELSKKSGVTEASISEYLKGKKEPLGKQSILIANALGVSLDVLWETDFANPEKKHILPTPFALKMAFLFDKANDTDKKIVELTLEKYNDLPPTTI